MSEYIAFDDCVAKYDGDMRVPTEWQGYPIHHTDPFWNAALFDEPQQFQAFSVAGPDFLVHGDWVSDDVILRAYDTGSGLLLRVKDGIKGYQSFFLEPDTLKAFRDFINTTK